MKHNLGENLINPQITLNPVSKRYHEFYLHFTMFPALQRRAYDGRDEAKPGAGEREVGN